MMNEQTIFLFYFIFILVSFHYGTSSFYRQFELFDSLQYDDVTFKLISLSLSSLLCAFFWNYYVSNYV